MTIKLTLPKSYNWKLKATIRETLGDVILELIKEPKYEYNRSIEIEGQNAIALANWILSNKALLKESTIVAHTQIFIKPIRLPKRCSTCEKEPTHFYKRPSSKTCGYACCDEHYEIIAIKHNFGKFSKWYTKKVANYKYYLIIIKYNGL